MGDVFLILVGYMMYSTKRGYGCKTSDLFLDFVYRTNHFLCGVNLSVSEKLTPNPDKPELNIDD